MCKLGTEVSKTFAEPWVALEAAYGLRELRSEEIVFGDVHAVSRSKKNMVDGSVGAIIQLDPDALASRVAETMERPRLIGTLCKRATSHRAPAGRMDRLRNQSCIGRGKRLTKSGRATIWQIPAGPTSVGA